MFFSDEQRRTNKWDRTRFQRFADVDLSSPVRQSSRLLDQWVSTSDPKARRSKRISLEFLSIDKDSNKTRRSTIVRRFGRDLSLVAVKNLRPRPVGRDEPESRLDEQCLSASTMKQDLFVADDREKQLIERICSNQVQIESQHKKLIRRASALCPSDRSFK